MPLDDALGNEQTESDTPAIVLFQLDEPVKNGFAHFIRNAFACIADATHNVVINVVEANDDGP